ncbi:MAG: carbohydrate-binding family 9-like protein [bacterium]
MKRTVLAIICGLGLSACQDVEQPTVVLTKEQWTQVQKHLLKSEPQPKYRIGATFDGKLELIGFDVTEPLVAGKPATFTWYWRALTDVSENWKVFVHFDSAAKPFRQNLDHVPVNDLYPTSRWKKGDIIEDVQTVTLRNDWPNGDATPYIGLYKGTQRMKPSGQVKLTKEGQPRVIGATLKVQGSSQHSQPAPAYALKMLDANSAAAIDGRLDEAVWEKLPELKLTPFGNAPALKTSVKAYVTPEALFIGAQLEDTNIWGNLNNRDADTWTEEVLEVFIDPNADGKDYLELQVTPQNTVFDANFKERLGQGEGSREDQINAARAFNLEGLETQVFVDGTLNDDATADKSWTVEIKIPLASLPGVSAPLAAGSTWAVNVYRFDRPQPGTTHAYGWSTGPRGDFHQVDKFGTWNLGPSTQPTMNPELLKQIERSMDTRVRDRLRPPALTQPKKPINADEPAKDP